MMRFGLSDACLNNIIGVLKQFPEVKAVYIYGSRAKRNYKLSSDIDLTLKGRELNLNILTKIMDRLDDLLLPYQFDISIYDQIENAELLEHINRVGIDLYILNKD